MKSAKYHNGDTKDYLRKVEGKEIRVQVLESLGQWLQRVWAVHLGSSL